MSKWNYLGATVYQFTWFTMQCMANCIVLNSFSFCSLEKKKSLNTNLYINSRDKEWNFSSCISLKSVLYIYLEMLALSYPNCFNLPEWSVVTFKMCISFLLFLVQKLLQNWIWIFVTFWTFKKRAGWSTKIVSTNGLHERSKLAKFYGSHLGFSVNIPCLGAYTNNFLELQVLEVIFFSSSFQFLWINTW